MEPIAIIGLAGRFPGAPTLERFWQNLRDGVESISQFAESDLTAEGVDPSWFHRSNYVNARGVLDGIEWFDARLFGMNPRSATVLDPQQRVFLECAWEALEDAGHDADRFAGSIAVYAGCSSSQYVKRVDESTEDGGTLGAIEVRLGTEKDSLALRTAYKLNLRGPAITVQSGCSTSLVAVTLACSALAHGECDMALAGGVAIRVPQRVGYLYAEGGIESRDGHCRAFDARASGSVGGSGCGVVVLRRLVDAVADGDTVHAVILGAAMNNDGADKIGFTAPSIVGQASVIAKAHAIAGITAESVSYVECHGTGTRLGDPIELAGLSSAFASIRAGEKTCAIGSVKTNIGHLDAAAGVAGLLKTVLALKNGELPPSLHFTTPNPDSCLESSPFDVNTRLRAWPRTISPRRAGVSSFGVGGTNAHVVLEEAPVPPAAGPGRANEVLMLSAKTPAALDQATSNLAASVRHMGPSEFADAVYTLQVGRKQLPCRRVAIAHGAADAADVLESDHSARCLTATAGGPPPQTVFMFPGQGSQRLGMAQDLFESEPTFREAFERCADILLGRFSIDLAGLLYNGRAALGEPSGDLLRTANTQPALFVVEYALAQLWNTLGIRPAAMLGHSVGEYVAAHLGGVMSLTDALTVVAERGRFMEACPPGAMIAVPLSVAAVEGFLNGAVEIAAINGPSRCTLSGSVSAIAEVEQQLTMKGIVHRRLATSHAFHSGSMDAAVHQLRAVMSGIALHPPLVPIISCVTGTWLTEQAAVDPNYWASQIRHTVRFADAIGVALADDNTTLLEVGPGNTLAMLARAHPESQRSTIAHSLGDTKRGQSDGEALALAAGQLWLWGHSLDWARFRRHEGRRRMALPTYPFERKRYWIDPKATRRATGDVALQRLEASETAPADANGEPLPPAPARPGVMYDRLEHTIAEVWKAVLGVDEIGLRDDFFALGGESLMLLQVAARVRDLVNCEIPAQVFLEARSIEALASRIRDRLIDTFESHEIMGDLLDRLDRLSDSDVRGMIPLE